MVDSPRQHRREVMCWHRVYWFVLLIAMFALTLTAQTGSGRVQGVLRDATSAVVSGASVTIANTATAVKSSTTSNEAGFFAFPPVVPGSYEVKVEATGMQTWEGKFLLQVGQTGGNQPCPAGGSGFYPGDG